MLEKNYKLAEMIFLEQVIGEERPDRRRDQRGKKKMRQTQGRKEHRLAGLPKIWGELLEMFIPLILLLIFLLCITPHNYCFFRKKSVSLHTPEPVFVILVRGGRSRFCGVQSLYNVRSPF